MGHRGSREPWAGPSDSDCPTLTLPSEQPEDDAEKDPIVLQMALERQLTGCTVSGRLGCGGESVCFAATVPPYKDVAVKVSLRGYSKADTLVEERAGAEVFIYNMLGKEESTAAIAPKLLGHGCLDLAGDSHPYMIMQRMGSNLHQLTHSVGLPTHKLVKYSLDMLRCLEVLHSAGWVHCDVKPENFCLRKPGQGESRHGAPSICLIDLGSCQERPSPEQEGNCCRFFGTTDYAGSTAIQRIHPGPGDDLESLSFSLLCLWNHGRLPWSFAACKPKGSSGWSSGEMQEMFEKREAAWEDACNHGDTVPPFIKKIHDYASSLWVCEMPDYNIVREQLLSAPRQRRPSRYSFPAATHSPEGRKARKRSSWQQNEEPAAKKAKKGWWPFGRDVEE